jgi:hypothetical protein
METEAEKRSRAATRAMAVVRPYAAAALSGMIANPHLMDAARSRSLADDGPRARAVADWVVEIAWLLGHSLAERESRAWKGFFAEVSPKAIGPTSPPLPQKEPA